jgi:diadenosine tetraphosphate (Ap4A) HIT family hydrolase
MTILDELNLNFNVQELKIYESKFWVWSLRPHQTTIGASILALNRECRNLSNLVAEEYVDLGNIIKVIETVLKKLFNYDVINYYLLMMFDKQLHYHIIPRYERPIEFIGKIWNDSSFPKIPSLLGESLDKIYLDKIINIIKSENKL